MRVAFTVFANKPPHGGDFLPAFYKDVTSAGNAAIALMMKDPQVVSTIITRTEVPDAAVGNR